MKNTNTTLWLLAKIGGLSLLVLSVLATTPVLS